MTELTLVSAYERLALALADAKSVTDALGIRMAAEQLRVVARQAGNRQMVADAMEIQVKAERALGRFLIEAREAGQIGTGRPRLDNGSSSEPLSRVTLKEAGIDKKLSMRSQQLARAGDSDFAQMLDRARVKIVGGGAVVVNPMKDLNTAEKKAKRASREVELARKMMALPDKRYGVIYADPEWRFEPYSRDTGMDRAADNHYPTSELEDIKSRDVASIAADDCVLFLWATAPMLPEAIDVMRAWGFAYKSHIVWRKLFRGDQTGTGYWFRGLHELLLVGTRGDIPAPALGTQWGSVKPADASAHSEKPDIFRQMIEQYYPTLPRIELNARRAVKGWDRWGFEAPDDGTLPDTANETAGGFPVAAAPVKAEQQGVGKATREANLGTSPVTDVTAGETATRHTKATAEPIMRARYGELGAKGLVQVLGRPEGTISRWALELGLSDRERLRGNSAHLGAYIKEKQE